MGWKVVTGGDFWVRNSGHSSFLQCCFSGDGFGSGNGLLDPSSAMTPSHQVIFQYLCMTGKIRIIRTNSSETKGLAESYPCLTMARVAAGGVEVLMGVCGFREKISGYSVHVLADSDIQEMGLTGRVLRCELDSPVEGIDMVSEGGEAVLIPGPDEKYIIDVSPPYPGATWR